MTPKPNPLGTSAYQFIAAQWQTQREWAEGSDEHPDMPRALLEIFEPEQTKMDPNARDGHPRR